MIILDVVHCCYNWCFVSLLVFPYSFTVVCELKGQSKEQYLLEYSDFHDALENKKDSQGIEGWSFLLAYNSAAF